jgi:hypothetical protein
MLIFSFVFATLVLSFFLWNHNFQMRHQSWNVLTKVRDTYAKEVLAVELERT